MKNNKRDDNGLTFVELIAVIAITATLGGLLVPQFMSYINNKREMACVENRDAVVNICEKMVYSGIPIDTLHNIVDEIVTTGDTSYAMPSEYKEALRSHLICPVDGSIMELNVTGGVIQCTCTTHSEKDVIADLAFTTGSGDNTADPSFAVPTVPGVSVTPPPPTPSTSPAPTVTASVISSSFWPYQNDSRWDGKRYNNASLWITAPSGKFAMRNSSGALVYYVLIDTNGKDGVKIDYNNCYDPSYYLVGRDQGFVIATNGTEYNAESIKQAAKNVSGLMEGGYDENASVNDKQFRIAGGTIFINENGDRFIYFAQGSGYTKLPTATNLGKGGVSYSESGRLNKFGNWYAMKATDEI